MTIQITATRRRTLLLSVACGGLLGLAGCGGGEDSTSSGDVRDQAEQAIRASLTESGTSDTQIDCVIDALPDYSDDEYQAIVDSYDKDGGVPPDVAADVGSATVDCVSG